MLSVFLSFGYILILKFYNSILNGKTFLQTWDLASIINLVHTILTFLHIFHIKEYVFSPHLF